MALASGRGVREDQWRDHYLWRAVDHEGEVLEVFATKRRDRRAALKFLKRAMKRYGRPMDDRDGPSSVLRCRDEGPWKCGRQECGRWLNNRAENSHQPFRRRERAMAKFRDVKDPAEVCRRPRLDPQSLQSGPPPQPPRHLQAEPIGRPGGMASAGGLNASDRHPSPARLRFV